MATSPIYSWPEPDNTDLVKNGALAIRTMGNAIDTTMATMTPKSIVDAKGDLIAATANDTPARLAVGVNGEGLVADSTTATGLRYQGSMAAGKNFVINGNFDIWQRSTSGTISGNGYPAADRWLVNVSAAGTSSRQTTGVPDGSQYCARNTFTSSSVINYYQLIETANASQLWGKTVTFSMKIRRNATLASNINVVIAKSATVDAGIAASWTNINATTVLFTSLPTGTTSADWFTATVTATIPNDGTANSIYVGSTSGTQASGAYLEFAQAQLELGSVATAFSRAGSTIAGELALCQRYYIRFVNDATSSSAGTTNGLFESATSGILNLALPVSFRNASGDLTWSGVELTDGVTAFVPSLLVVNQISKQAPRLKATITGATTYRPAFAYLNGANAYLALNGEL